MARIFPSEISAADVAFAITALNGKRPFIKDRVAFFDFDFPLPVISSLDLDIPSLGVTVALREREYDLQIRRDIEEAFMLLPHLHAWVVRLHAQPNDRTDGYDDHDLTIMNIDGDEIYLEYTARIVNSGLWGHTFSKACFDNPSRAVAFSPEWRTDAVLAITQQMSETRDFSAMPILADALQDAGCDNEHMLNHCRGPYSHDSDCGCWVVKLVLGSK